MSETVHYTGKLKLIEKLNNETLEEQCKRILKEYNYLELSNYCDSWAEMIYDKLYDTYIIYDDEVYKVIDKNHRDTDEDIFEAYKNEDGTISYELMYYNGGCGFNEAIEYALGNIK